MGMIPPVVVPLQHQGGFPGFPIENVQVPDALVQLGLLRRGGGAGLVLQGDDPRADQVRAVAVRRRHPQQGHLPTSPSRRQKAGAPASQPAAQFPQRVRPAARQQISPRYSSPPHIRHSPAGKARWLSRRLLCTILKKIPPD